MGGTESTTLVIDYDPDETDAGEIAQYVEGQLHHVDHVTDNTHDSEESVNEH